MTLVSLLLPVVWPSKDCFYRTCSASWVSFWALDLWSNVTNIVWMTGCQGSASIGSCPVLPLSSTFGCWAFHWSSSRLRTRVKPNPGSTVCTPHILYWAHCFFGSCRCFLVVHVGAMWGPVIVENWPTSYSLHQTSPKGTWSTTITCPGQKKTASSASCLFTGNCKGASLAPSVTLLKYELRQHQWYTTLSRKLPGSSWKGRGTARSKASLELKKYLSLYCRSCCRI